MEFTKGYAIIPFVDTCVDIDFMNIALPKGSMHMLENMGESQD